MCAASISAHVADLLLFPPVRHPQHVSQSCAHGARIWRFRSRLFFLAFMLSSLSPGLFPVFYYLPLVCKKMNRTLAALSTREGTALHPPRGLDGDFRARIFCNPNTYMHS